MEFNNLLFIYCFMQQMQIVKSNQMYSVLPFKKKLNAKSTFSIY